MNLIQEYMELTKICAITDYESEKSVAQHNKSVGRMYEIVEKIGNKQSTETIEDYAKLLDITDNKTNIWTAIHILERVSDNIIKEKALKIIKKQANEDSADSMGFKMWLDNYKK